MKFTTKQVADFLAYDKVRRSREFNMYDQAAVQAAGLTPAEYDFVRSNFAQLAAAAVDATVFTADDVKFHLVPSPMKPGILVRQSYGVEAVHTPSGLSVQTFSGRTQWENKKLALEQLEALFGKKEHAA